MYGFEIGPAVKYCQNIESYTSNETIWNERDQHQILSILNRRRFCLLNAINKFDRRITKVVYLSVNLGPDALLSFNLSNGCDPNCLWFFNKSVNGISRFIYKYIKWNAKINFIRNPYSMDRTKWWWWWSLELMLFGTVYRPKHDRMTCPSANIFRIFIFFHSFTNKMKIK